MNGDIEGFKIPIYDLRTDDDCELEYEIDANMVTSNPALNITPMFKETHMSVFGTSKNREYFYFYCDRVHVWAHQGIIYSKNKWIGEFHLSQVESITIHDDSVEFRLKE